jgi:hypothetical protein
VLAASKIRTKTQATSQKTITYKNIVTKPEGNVPFGKPRRREEYNIKMDSKEIVRMMTGFSGFGIKTGRASSKHDINLRVPV